MKYIHSEHGRFFQHRIEVRQPGCEVVVGGLIREGDELLAELVLDLGVAGQFEDGEGERLGRRLVSANAAITLSKDAGIKTLEYFTYMNVDI